MAADPTQHKSWPELVGKRYDEAKATIEKENPDLNVSMVRPGQPMTRDYRADRVRIMVDDHDIVKEIPSVG